MVGWDGGGGVGACPSRGWEFAKTADGDKEVDLLLFSPLSFSLPPFFPLSLSSLSHSLSCTWGGRISEK